MSQEKCRTIEVSGGVHQGKSGDVSRKAQKSRVNIGK